jgi:DNA repair ATPase RecN
VSKKKSKKKNRLAQFEAQTWLNGRVIGNLLDRTNELAAVLKKVQADQTLEGTKLEGHATTHRMNDAEFVRLSNRMDEIEENQNNQAVDVVALAQRLEMVEEKYEEWSAVVSDLTTQVGKIGQRMDGWAEQYRVDQERAWKVLNTLNERLEHLEKRYAQDTGLVNDTFMRIDKEIAQWRAAGKADNERINVLLREAGSRGEQLNELQQQVPLLIKGLADLTAMRREVVNLANQQGSVSIVELRKEADAPNYEHKPATTRRGRPKKEKQDG